MGSGEAAEQDEQQFEALLEYLKYSRGFDFTGYKRASLRRRVLKRMSEVQIDKFEQYQDYLEVHPTEFTQLFNTILINVTTFFRDPSAWAYVSQHVIPMIVAKPADQHIRVWCAGCADGSEAYTVAILLAEALGIDAYRQRVKIYGGDADEEALAQARQARYSLKSLQDVPPELLDKYFEPGATARSFRNDLRRTLIFGRHDLVQDAPISRLDLLVCRNTLMYFNTDAQARILRNFYYALNPGSFLFLGKAEMLVDANRFAPLDLKHRIFTKQSRASERERRLPTAYLENNHAGTGNGRVPRLRDAAFDAAPGPQVVIDFAGNLMMANQAARSIFALGARELGQPFRDVELSYRPVELRSCLERAYADRLPVSIENVEQALGNGQVRAFDVQVQPLLDGDGPPLGASISFMDVTRHSRLQRDLLKTHQDLETAYEELQSANEELETTNEELQSALEELETTNEELNSSNEEHETTNEELQATNEELQTLNDELGKRTADYHQANDFLQAVLTGLRSGVAVVDRQLSILAWNREAQQLWGLRADEVVGRFLLDLDIGLPLVELTGTLQALLAGRATANEVLLRATNRRGRSIACRVTCSPLQAHNRDITGVILLMDDVTDGPVQAAGQDGDGKRPAAKDGDGDRPVVEDERHAN